MRARRVTKTGGATSIESLSLSGEFRDDEAARSLMAGTAGFCRCSACSQSRIDRLTFEREDGEYAFMHAAKRLAGHEPFEGFEA